MPSTRPIAAPRPALRTFEWIRALADRLDRSAAHAAQETAASTVDHEVGT
jgi:hypothetical protein